MCIRRIELWIWTKNGGNVAFELEFIFKTNRYFLCLMHVKISNWRALTVVSYSLNHKFVVLSGEQHFIHSWSTKTKNKRKKNKNKNFNICLSLSTGKSHEHVWIHIYSHSCYWQLKLAYNLNICCFCSYIVHSLLKLRRKKIAFTWKW